MTDPTTARVAVIGSMNVDYVTRVEDLPMPGETVAAQDFEVFRGGKGANQAIAARRQGCEVTLFGTLGADEAGDAYRKALQGEGIDVGQIRNAPAPTGSAFITVDETGENTIVIARGANDRLRQQDIERGEKEIAACGALLGQFEVPVPSLLEAAKIAERHKVPTIINPSPFDAMFPWGGLPIDYVIANEHEAAELLEFPASREDASSVRQRLTEFRIGHLIVTRGGDDTIVFPHHADPFLVDTLTVLPIDTVGAGDAFAGCFAAWIAAGEPIEEAVRAANCAGALTTLGGGAQRPIPDRESVCQHLAQIPEVSR